MVDVKGPEFELRASPSAASPRERSALIAAPGFGTVFTDHMAVAAYSQGIGWHEPRVEARAPLLLDPATAVLHYAQCIFEGLKAYRTPDGGACLFRPQVNAQRFQASAARLAMPELPEDWFIASLEALIRADRDWIPEGDGSLYLRPFMFASEAFLGVRPATEYRYLVIASPVGGYFKSGRSAITLWVSTAYSRAARGGTGAAKCGGNYAASLLPQAEATAAGCDQVVFLDAAEGRFVEELGGMNLFFVFDDGSIVTPPLGGTILAGNTRAAIIELALDRGWPVREARYAFDDWRRDARSGRLTEVFACGTAAVVAPVGRVLGPDDEIVIGDGGAGPVAGGLRDALVAIQRGLAPDPRGWTRRVL